MIGYLIGVCKDDYGGNDDKDDYRGNDDKDKDNCRLTHLGPKLSSCT